MLTIRTSYRPASRLTSAKVVAVASNGRRCTATCLNGETRAESRARAVRNLACKLSPTRM